MRQMSSPWWGLPTAMALPWEVVTCIPDAIEAFEKALAVCKSFKGNSDTVASYQAQALGNKGAVLGDLDLHAEAVLCYDTPIALYPNTARWTTCASTSVIASNAVAVVNKGWTLINLGREQEGFRCHECHRADPTQPPMGDSEPATHPPASSVTPSALWRHLRRVPWGNG